MRRRGPLTGSSQAIDSIDPTAARPSLDRGADGAESPPARSSRAAIAVEALRRGVTTRAAVEASAAALRRRTTSRGSIAAAALRRLAS